MRLKKLLIILNDNDSLIGGKDKIIGAFIGDERHLWSPFPCDMINVLGERMFETHDEYVEYLKEFAFEEVEIGRVDIVELKGN